jgi:hypothetical protein
MNLINTVNGYDFYISYNIENKPFYNIIKHGEKIPEAGYLRPDIILNIKGFKPEDEKYFYGIEGTLKNIFLKGSYAEVYGITEEIRTFIINNNLQLTDSIINQIELIASKAVKNSKQR